MQIFHRPSATLFVLIGVTLISVMFAETASLGRVAYVIIFAAAVLKGQLVAVYFMETPRALPVWNSLYRLWIAAIGVALCVGMALVP